MSSPENSTDPKLWGPALWKFLHSMAANYPQKPNPQYRASSRQFFYSLRHLLPCEMCRTHYSALLSKRQPQTESAHALQEWVLWMHNEVNRRIKPDNQMWNIGQVKEMYKPDANANHDPTSHLMAHLFRTQVNMSMPVDETSPEYKNIMRPLDELHSMLFNTPTQDSTLNDSKTPSLESSQKQTQITEVSQGQETSQDGQQLSSSETLNANQQSQTPPPVTQTSETLVSVQPEPLKAPVPLTGPIKVPESLPLPGLTQTPPTRKFTSIRQRLNRRNPLQTNRKPANFNQKKIRPYSARSNASRPTIQNQSRMNQQHKPVVEQPVTFQPPSDCKDKDEKKDCGCGNK
jgi:hypothetical protein